MQNLTQMIARALDSEYDCVCCVDLSNGESVSRLSISGKNQEEILAESYSQILGRFLLRVAASERERAELSRTMQIPYVLERLKENKEYIVYITIEREEELLYKKLRFCFGDEEQQTILLTQFDVTGIVRERRLLEQELEKSREQMRYVLVETTDMVFEYDLTLDLLVPVKIEGRARWPVIRATGAAKRLVRDGYLNEAFERQFDKALENVRNGIHRLSLQVQVRSGLDEVFRWYRFTFFDYLEAESRKRKVLAYVQDIEQSKRSQDALRKEAQSDPLTGLLNAREGQRQIQERLLHQEMNAFCAMFIMDLDNFKQINDTRGHRAGDDALRHFATVLRETFRADDVIYRLGGDEFVVFAQRIENPEETVKWMMQRFFSHLAEEGGDVLLTSSVGVYAARNQYEFDHYYESADQALYQTKQRGKAAYTLATEG